MRNSRYLSIGQASIYLEVINESRLSDAIPLVLLHEGLGSSAQWNDFPELLATQLDVTVILYDRLGYGKSSSLENDNELKMSRESDFYLPEILKQLDVQKVDVFGHSDGATIALLFASSNSQQCRKVIAEAPHVLIEETTVIGVQGAIWAYQHRGLKDHLNIYHGFRTESMFWRWANFWKQESKKRWDMLGELGKINSSVLYIQGDKDKYGTLKQGEIIQQYIQGEYSKLILKGCGHIPHQIRKDDVLEAIVNFLRA
jgi:pimeloyl-ACP methyl ester carboxylesterase